MQTVLAWTSLLSPRGTQSLLTSLLFLAYALPLAAQNEWSTTNGDKGSRRYSELDQIHAGNVADLEVAWRWFGPDAIRVQELVAQGDRSAARSVFEATPVYSNGVLYTSTPHSDVVAIDAGSGKTLWHFDTESWTKGRPSNVGWIHRGVARWQGAADVGDPDSRTVERIFIGTGDAKLWSVDAVTGEPVGDFGDDGAIDLKSLMRRNPTHRAFGVSSAPMVCGDVVVVGSTISDRPMTQRYVPGDVQAFDVRTGKPKWTFYNPPLPDEPGYDTWENGSADYTGNANVWTGFSCDEELGLVYLPFSTPTDDFYGGHRHGDGLFGESLVAVDAATGELSWYFQTVHHGVWDYDLPTPPIFADLEVEGRKVRALAQITKQGFVFVLDRSSGEPVWPIEERAVPSSTIPGEKLAATQPFPTKPAPFIRQGIRAEDVVDYTPEIRAEALATLAKYNTGEIYLPPRTDRFTINFPGNAGGANWPGAALDPETNVLYVPSHYGPTSIILNEPDSSRSDLRYVPDIEIQIPGPQGLHLLKPPYSTITAIDLDSADTLWQVPHGEGPLAHPVYKDRGP